jgi:hypothetical protein
MRRILGLRGEEATGGRRELHNEHLCKLPSSLDLTAMMKSRKIRQKGEWST